MKKEFSLILALVLCLSLCACGGGNSDTPDIPETTEATQAPTTEANGLFQFIHHKNIDFSSSDIMSFEDPEFENFLCVMLDKDSGTITGQDLLSIEYFGYFEGSPTEAESLTNYSDKDTLYWNSVLVSTEPCPDYLDELDVLCLTAGEDGLSYRRRGTLVIVQSNEWMAEHVFPYLYYFKNVDRFAFAYCWMSDYVCLPENANFCFLNTHARDFEIPYDPDYS